MITTISVIIDIKTLLYVCPHLAIESLSNLADSLRDLGVLVARFDQPQSSLAGQVGSHQDVSLASRHWSVSSGSQDKAVGHHGDESINVGSQVDLDQVSISQDAVRLAEEGRVVADDVVDGDAGGEGNS